MPAANWPRTKATETRVPEMTGFPKATSGSAVAPGTSSCRISHPSAGARGRSSQTTTRRRLRRGDARCRSQRDENVKGLPSPGFLNRPTHESEKAARLSFLRIFVEPCGARFSPHNPKVAGSKPAPAIMKPTGGNPSGLRHLGAVGSSDSRGRRRQQGVPPTRETIIASVIRGASSPPEYDG